MPRVLPLRRQVRRPAHPCCDQRRLKVAFAVNDRLTFYADYFSRLAEDPAGPVIPAGGVQVVLRPRVPAAAQAVLKPLARLADERDLPLYVVGGCVRDWLTGRSSLDLDLVCEGDPAPLQPRPPRNCLTAARKPGHGTLRVLSPASRGFRDEPPRDRSGAGKPAGRRGGAFVGGLAAARFHRQRHGDGAHRPAGRDPRRPFRRGRRLESQAPTLNPRPQLARRSHRARVSRRSLRLPVGAVSRKRFGAPSARGCRATATRRGCRRIVSRRNSCGFAIEPGLPRCAAAPLGLVRTCSIRA